MKATKMQSFGLAAAVCCCLLLRTTNAQEVRIGNFVTRQHLLQGEVWALNDRVMEVRNMIYDGRGPAAYFWADTSSTPSPGGMQMYAGPPATQCDGKLPEIRGGNFLFEFPEHENKTIHDFLGGSLSVWCEAFDANFGEVVVDQNLDLSGLPSLASGAGPGLACGSGTPPRLPIAATPQGYSCERLIDNFQVRWKVLKDENEIAIELLGRIDDDVYMGFGVSGATNRALMLGADPVIADFFGGQARARDFYMDERAQCAENTGVCADSVGQFQDDVVEGSVSGEREDGLSLVRFRRPLQPTNVNDRSNGHLVDHGINAQSGVFTPIIWALGPVDQESGDPFFHRFGVSRDLIQFEFGREAQNNCELLTEPEEEEEEVFPFLRPVLTDTTEFHAVIGPSGGERGYASISGGRSAWGIAWYINDILVPVLEMRRGTKYTFRINGGDDPDAPSEFHPFYLTTAIGGGYVRSDAKTRSEETVFAGIDIIEQSADFGVTEFEPTAVGPLCMYTESDDSSEALAGGFQSYFSTLNTSCTDDTTNEAGVLEFTPDEDTPDLIYYQCVTHSNLGWEIHVIDADAPSILDVDYSNFGNAPIQLTDELTLNAIIDPIQNTLTVELIYRGEGWVGMAFTDGSRSMVGAEAVIGLPGEPNSPSTNPAKYSLNARNVPGVVRMAAEKQTLMNATITQDGGKTILKFTKHLVEPGEHQIFPDKANTFLFAHGSNNNLGFHAGFGAFELLPNQCAVRIAGELQNEHALNQQQGNFEVDVPDDNRELWIAHGVCASAAWGILVPLAVGASLIRKVLVKLGFPEDAWFQLHRSLNLLAAALTLVAFSLAVHAINQSTPDDPEHFSGITHRRLGLIIFILTMAQALNGILRPHISHGHAASSKSAQGESSNSTKAAEESQFDTEANPSLELKNKRQKQTTAPHHKDEKTLARKGWEVFHRILGATLLGAAWWQVQDGLGLFAERFDEENLDTVFWIVLSSIVGSVGIAFVYSKLAL